MRFPAAAFARGEGEYRYRLNGEEAAVREVWRVDSVDDNSCTVLSAREAAGVAITVTAQVSHGAIASCRLCWEGEPAGTVEAVYQVDHGGLTVKRRVNEGTWEKRAIAVDAHSVILYPLMRIFTGPVIRALDAAGGRGTVIVPSVAGPLSQDSLLWPQLSERRVYRERQVPAATAAELWRFIGGQYDAEASFQLDSRGRLLTYCWRQDGQGRWEVSLVE